MSQPMPQDGEVDGTPELIGLLTQRMGRGLAKYGKPLQTKNGRDALWDALEEALDLCQYLAQAVLERNGKLEPRPEKTD